MQNKKLKIISANLRFLLLLDIIVFRLVVYLLNLICLMLQLNNGGAVYVISVCITWQRYCTAIGWSSGDVIRTIRTICNYISNYIYSKCKMQNKKSCSNLFLNSCRKDLQKVYASHDYPDVHCPMNYRSLHTLHSTWISTN